LTRRVSIGDGAHRKKSHADGSSLFQWLTTAGRRSNFIPPNAARRAKTHNKGGVVVTRETGPRKGRSPHGIRLRILVAISYGLRARGNVKLQGQRFGFRGAGAQQNCRAIGVGPNFTARSSIGFDVVSKYVAGRAPRKNLRRVPAPVQNEVAALGRRSPPLNLSKTGSMAPLDAALLAHRRKRASQIVVALRDLAGQGDE
jgi:hypothetical protein